MFRFILASLLLVGLVDHIYSIDYCTANLCPSGVPNFYGQTLTVESLIDDFVRMWWDEHFDTSLAHIDSYPSNHVGPAIGHFTQMASDRTWGVGCAIQNWLEDGIWITYYIVCNYSFTNIVNQPVYVRGTTASGCTTGRDPRYPGLCSVNEVVQSVP
uniref:SCP domain-containing protein n=1 Tax=Anopheles minimus TaxID=112268 RepID=A0A182WC67_9DIPT